MNGIEPEKKKNTLIRWVFGVLFLLLSLGMFSSSFIAGLFFLLAAVVSIPSAAKQLENKLNVRIPGVARFFVVFLLVAVAISATPSTSAPVNNTEIIAAPPSTVSGSEAVVVPSEPAQVATPTPASAPTPTETPIKTLADKEPDSNYVTTDTPTPDNKGTVDIVTIPAGATVTVDGVSQGLSPVNGLSVDTGNHNVDLYLSGYNAKTLTLDITNSDTKTIDWTFTPLENPNPTPTQNSTSTPTPTYIDKTATTSTDKTTPTNTGGTLYASSESNKYHSAGCRYVSKIKPEHLITFNSRQEAETAGYSSCSVCGG